MLDSRKSYGYGCIGSNQKGYEYKILFDDEIAQQNIVRTRNMSVEWVNKYMNTMKSGYVFGSQKKAIEEGTKWLKKHGRTGKVEAIKAEGYRFEY